MDIRDGFLDTIGNTPLIRLAGPSRETGCEILGKAEFLNPGGSVKDRAALYIVRDAERRGTLRPGGTVVEGTAGNTGIGLAHICAARGYRCVIVIPDNQSPEKMDLLRQLGAELRPVPPKPYRDPDNYQKIAGRLAAELPDAIWANQFDNVVNRQAHYETTGPELWRDTEGRIDAFTCATGTGGTLAGVARYLKERNPDIQILAVEPPSGEKVEGLRSLDDGYIPPVFEKWGGYELLNGKSIVRPRESLEYTRRLADVGIFSGISAGAALAGAVKVAKRIESGTIVFVVCDYGWKYLSTGAWTLDLDEATANIDVRQTPDEDAAKFLDLVKEVVNDPNIEVAYANPASASRPPTPNARLDSDAFTVLESMLSKHYNAITLPTMSTGATDMAYLRQKGMQCYGIGPAIDIEDGPKGYGAHSDQERILESELHRFVRFNYDAVVGLAGQK